MKPFLIALRNEMPAELMRETARVDRDNKWRRDQFTQNTRHANRGESGGTPSLS
jgi:hypothetical protein